MRRHWFGTLKKRETGGAALEFAAVLPVLVLIILGVADFARVYFTDVTAANASRVGAEWGVAYTGITDSMTKGAKMEAGKDSIGMTITAGKFCNCPDGSTPACTGSCGSYGSPREFDSVAVRKVVNLILKYPGMPDSLVVLRKTILRGN
jgi:hypothetical protein